MYQNPLMGTREKRYDILFVEDDSEDRMILKDAFAEQDCADRITTYESGFDFLQQLAEIRLFSPPPDLIIMDYNLNGANADILLQQVKADIYLKDVPVIIYTSFCTKKLHDECLKNGAFDCIEKGNTYQQVVNFASKVCDYLWGMKPSDEQQAGIA